MESRKGKKKIDSQEEMEEMESQRQKEEMKMKLQKEMEEMESQVMGESLDSSLDRPHLSSTPIPFLVANLKQRSSFSGHFRYFGSADASSSSRSQLPMTNMKFRPSFNDRLKVFQQSDSPSSSKPLDLPSADGSMADLSNLRTTRLDLTKISLWSSIRRVLKSFGDDSMDLPISTTPRYNCDNHAVAKLAKIFKPLLELLSHSFSLMIKVLFLVGMMVDTQLTTYIFGKVDHMLERMNGHDISHVGYVQLLAYSFSFLLLTFWLILNSNTSPECSHKEEQVHSLFLCLGGMAIMGFVIVSSIGLCSQLSPYAVVQVFVWVLFLIASGFRDFWK